MSLNFDQLNADGFLCFATNAYKSTLEIAQQLGEVLRLEGIADVQSLTPKSAEETTKNRYSGLYGTGFFPLHSDMAHWHVPPRYFLLRCLQPAQNVPTCFVRSRDIFSSESDSTLKRALFRPRRRQDGRLTCLRLREGGLYRWDPVFLKPVNKLALDLRCRIADRIASSPQRLITLTKSGDCIVVDNWKTLHGRAPVPPDAMHRRIERVYLGSLKL